MRARAKVYHVECFRCVACSRQLIPGDEFALREDGLFCRADHDVVERASMAPGEPLSPLHPARPLQMAGKLSVLSALRRLAWHDFQNLCFIPRSFLSPCILHDLGEIFGFVALQSVLDFLSLVCTIPLIKLRIILIGNWYCNLMRKDCYCSCIHYELELIKCVLFGSSKEMAGSVHLFPVDFSSSLFILPHECNHTCKKSYLFINYFWNRIVLFYLASYVHASNRLMAQSVSS